MSLRVALVQMDPRVGDLAVNAAAVLAGVQEAASRGADLVAFPEMALTGYPLEDLALRASFRRAAAAAMADLATDLEAAGHGARAVVVGGLGTDAAGRATNVACVLRGGVVEATYTKHHLPNYGVFDEYRVFAPGELPVAVEVAGARVGLAICEDIWQSSGPSASYEGLDLLVVLNGSPFEIGKQSLRLERAGARARALDAPVAYVNMVGGQDDLVFDGGSFVVEPGGAVVASARQFRPEILIWDAATSASRGVPAPVFSHAPSSPAASSGASPALSPGTSSSGAPARPLPVVAQVYLALVTGLRDYVVKNGFRRVAVGLSGGIDSALVAAIAADAVGGANVTGVSMPSRHSSQHSKDDAADLAERCGLDYRVHPIQAMVDAFAAELHPTGVAAENLQARVRGTILMTLSNAEGHLVLAPGNKSELATGYSTIYGDAVGGYAPLKDVFKTTVWALARWRNQAALDRGQIPPIPESSITKPPSAELSPGQMDTDSLPEYTLLDQVLADYVGDAAGRDRLLAKGYPVEVVDRVLRLVDRAEWKRRQYPPGPKVSALAFGRDRRLPITSSWREAADDATPPPSDAADANRDGTTPAGDGPADEGPTTDSPTADGPTAKSEGGAR